LPRSQSLEEATREVSEQFYALSRAAIYMPVDEFRDSLEAANPKIFELRNNKGYGLNFFDQIIYFYSHPPDEYRYRSPYTKAQLLDRMFERLGILIEYRPDQLMREDRSTHNGHPDAWMEYHAAYTAYQREDAVAGPERDAFLEKLATIYNLPRDDDALLHEMQNTTYPQLDRLLYYAAYQNFPESIAYGIEHCKAQHFWKLKDKDLFPHIDPNQIDAALNAYPKRHLTPQQRMHFLDLLADQDGLWDVMKDYGRHVIAPAFLLMALNGKPLSAENFNAIGPLPSEVDIAHNLPHAIANQWLNEGMAPTKILERFEQLTRTWHHNAIRFAPRGLLPREMPRNREYPTERIYALLPEPYRTQDGKYVIRSYTKKAEFDQAHKELGTCIDTYWNACRQGQSHILAIETADGNLLSNVEIQLKPQNDTSVTEKILFPFTDKILP
jgi:hypothetical protein